MLAGIMHSPLIIFSMLGIVLQVQRKVLHLDNAWFPGAAVQTFENQV
jgi:hypothetical protein